MTTTHPSRGDLAAFATGMVDEATMHATETHLAGCEACRTAMKSIPPDGLETLIREAANVSQEQREEDASGEGRKSDDPSTSLQADGLHTMQGSKPYGIRALRFFAPFSI